MAVKWLGPWVGGMVRVRADGTKAWRIERTIKGQRFVIALNVHTEPQAIGEYGLFLRDPAAYQREYAARAQATSLTLTTELVDEFLEHLKTKERDLKYRQNLHHYLGKWREELGTRDLRTLALADLKSALRAWGTAERHRVIAIKSFFSFLREELAVLPHAVDPTLALVVPAPRPEKSLRTKGYPIDLVERFYRAIEEQDVRDVICVRAKSGLHETEVGRILEGRGAIREVKTDTEIVATLTVIHKSGRKHIQSIDAQTLAAIRRLVARSEALGKQINTRTQKPFKRNVDNARQHRALEVAAEKLTNAAREADPEAKVVEPIDPGELRHSFVTWARSLGREVRPKDAGVDLAKIAQAIGHQSARTTARFYDGTEVPAMIVVPLRLVHPNDPPIPSAESKRSP